jgi:hypothetical protein
MNLSTNIQDLPVDPIGVNNLNNGITMTATDSIQESAQSNALSLDQSTINQIVSGLQQASVNGGTQLPSRDIPMVTTSYSNDPEVQPNYVPTKNTVYIDNFEKPEEMVQDYNRRVSKDNSLDQFYNELQSPLFLSVLYFMFQLPFFKKNLFTYLPFLFSLDGNYNIYGFLFTSILFGATSYFFNKIFFYFNAF